MHADVHYHHHILLGPHDKLGYSTNPRTTIQNIFELEAQNYNLIFADLHSVYLVNATMQALTSRSYNHNHTICLAEMLKNATISNDLPNNSAAFTKEFIRTFTKEKLMLKCYVGKQVINTAESYIGILPPRHEQVARATEKFVLSGILFHMLNKFFNMLAVTRS